MRTIRRPITMLAGMLAAAATLPGVASAELYNPTTMESFPTSYYYPPPAPSYDPPPMVFPPLSTSTSSPSGGSSGPKSRPRPTREERILGYHRSSRISRDGNRQLAALFLKRLGKRQFDRAGFLRESNKGTFRTAYRGLVSPLGWSDTDVADALAAYTISSYMIVHGVTELTLDERIGAQAVVASLRKKLLANRKMRRTSARGKQLMTERLSTFTVIQLAQFAGGDAASRASQAEAARTAGLKTFKGDLSLVTIGLKGFEPRTADSGR
ncbi:DUF6683 family protein [Patulibacter sp. NPDC049589]|uniref:DUF6683 family protein n=1 Tax=Patulibacter sp. NPDC049589 TaxID=3154731 RepID=UPI00343E08A1